MRRSLVLTTESARHAFRASLPPRVFQIPVPDLPEPRRNDGFVTNDVRGFMMAYSAIFTAVTAFIV